MTKHMTHRQGGVERDLTLEAHGIIRGTTLMRPSRMHLLAMKYEMAEAVELLQRVYAQAEMSGLPIPLRDDIEEFVKTNSTPETLAVLNRFRSGRSDTPANSATETAPSPVAAVSVEGNR